jgi:thioredoxin reductase (NADPH)
LAAATFRDRTNKTTRHCALRHLFLFIGADPNAAWLKGCVDTDDKGFVVTGRDFTTAVVRRPAFLLETSRPGIFAVGDVRSGSTKRVAAAVGEGAAVVAQIHRALALAPTPPGRIEQPMRPSP